MFYAPLAQHVVYDQPVLALIDHRTHYIGGAVLRLRASAMGMEALIRKVFSDVDPNLTLINVQPMKEQVDSTFDQRRAVAQMTGLFGLLALVLAAVGLYGVTAYTVERRTSEIGVRMALGANRSNVVRLVLRGAFRQVVIGLAIRDSDFDRLRTSDSSSAVPGQELGSVGTRRVHRSTGILRTCRQRDSCAAGCFDQSGGSVAHRVMDSPITLHEVFQPDRSLRF
jgi:hypothetical protein